MTLRKLPAIASPGFLLLVLLLLTESAYPVTRNRCRWPAKSPSPIKLSDLASDLDDDWDRIERKAGKTDPGVAWQKWSDRFKGAPGAWYRGMFLNPDGKDLRVILTQGLSTKKTRYKEIYFSKDRSEAIGYMPHTWAEGSGTGSQIRILLVMDKDTVKDGVSKKDVPASKIKKIYVFNKKGPASFPFLVYTPEQLLQIIDSP